MSAANENRMTTYKMADGEMVAGEFSWVTELDYFDMDTEPSDLIVEVWERVSVSEMSYPPPRCLECFADDKPLSETDDGLLCAGCAAEYASVAAHQDALAASAPVVTPEGTAQ